MKKWLFLLPVLGCVMFFCIFPASQDVLASSNLSIGLFQEGYPAPNLEITPTPYGTLRNSKIFLPSVSHLKTKIPEHSLSYYVYTANGMNDLGIFHGEKDAAQPNRNESYIIMTFGIADYQQGFYAAKNWYGNSYSISALKIALEDFANGYIYGLSGKTDEHAYVIVSINNDDSLDAWYQNSAERYKVEGHGAAWANMITDLNSWADGEGIIDRVSFYGGMDIEPEFSTLYSANEWLAGFGNNATTFLWNFGTAPCPVDYPLEGQTTYQTPGYCGNGWNQEWIWYVSQGDWFLKPLPEIYVPYLSQDPVSSEANARQWYRVGLIGQYNNPSPLPLQFEGVLTQYNACTDDKGNITSKCQAEGAYNDPFTGYTQLKKWASMDGPEGVTSPIHFLTDIMRYEGTRPAEHRLP